MTRERYTNELAALQDRILKLGSQVGENIVRVTEAMIGRDLVVSAELVAADTDVNAECIDISMTILQLIALQQPIAGDMRLLAAGLEIVDELERIHDYVKSVGKISVTLGEDKIDRDIGAILTQMAEKGRFMLHLAMDAFAKRDADLAQTVPPRDDFVDRLFEDANRRVIEIIMQDASQATKANYLQWASHNLERAADRAINICEWVVYLATAVYREFDSEYEMPQP